MFPPSTQLMKFRYLDFHLRTLNLGQTTLT